MQVLKINLQPNTSYNKLTNTKFSYNNSYYTSSMHQSKVCYGRDLVHFHGLDKIPITEISSRSEKDITYIKSLSSATGCPVENLKAVVGIDEFKSILKGLNSENYNPNSSRYMINTHTHTQWSDGKASVEKILDEAQQRGKASGNNFLIGITDHDCIDSGREAIHLISKNPEKYNKIRFVVGIEPCLKYENPKILKEPIPFDAIGYCINPFDKKTRKLFEVPMNANRNYAKIIINEANKRWSINATYDKACEYNPLIRTGGSSGFFKFTKEYLENTLKQEGKNYKSNEVLELFKPYYANSNGRVTIATTNVIDAVKLINESGSGEIGIAHPGIVELNPKIGLNFDFSSNANLQNGISYDKALAGFIETSGLRLAEVNYQYPEKYFEKYPQFEHRLKVINKACEENGVIAAGGTDSHGNISGKILEDRY